MLLSNLLLQVKRRSTGAVATRYLTSNCFLVALVILATTPVSTRAASESLESSVLRIELNASPYSFRIIERSTGETLLSTSATQFTENGFPVSAATDIRKQANSLTATLSLERTDSKARLSLAFVNPDVVQVLLTYERGNAGDVLQQFADQGEHYYGIWEYPFGGNIDNRGVDRDFMGVDTLPDVNYSSARAPFYVTSKKYGIYVESTAEGHFAIAVDGKTSFSFRDSQLKYDIIYGPSYAQVFDRYNAMAGPSIMPPLWAFSTVWWRDDNHDDLRDVSNAQEKVIQDADRLRALHIPASAIWLDRPFGTGEHGWGNMDFDPGFPNPSQMISDLKERGMNLLLWIANRCSAQLLEEGSAKGYVFPREWPAADVRRPEVYAWFKDKLAAYVGLGVRGYKIDRGEESEMPPYLENVNAILYPKLAAEGLRDSYGNDFFEFSRNANDTARKYTAIWNGDTRPTFGGLAASVKTAQRSGAINFPMWASDTGGYLGNPNKELFARWLEFSAYSPMMEVLIGPKRTIWYDFDQELVDIARRCAVAHHDLIPYTRSFLYRSTQSGMPVVRSLTFAYPGDKNLYQTWDEYLFGSELLVAPAVTEGATSRSVYLPAGSWLDYNEKRTVLQGPTNIRADAPIGTIPVYVRDGAIIPRGDILKANNNWDSDWRPHLRIEFFPSASMPSEFAYYTGSAVRTIKMTPRGGAFTIDLPDLGTSGSLEIYCKNLKSVKKDGKALQAGDGYRYDAQAGRLALPFSGGTSLEIEAASLFGAR